jgi:TldD protein
MKRTFISIALMSCLLNAAPSTSADETNHAGGDASPIDSAPPVKDVRLDALTDEMNRSLKDLKLPGHAAPYFVSYTLKEIDEATLSSCLGSNPLLDHLRYRVLLPQVRLGSYELDSSWPVTTQTVTITPMTTDDDYKAIRRSTWLSTDNAYKAGVQLFEWKKAYLRSNVIPDRLADLTQEPPVVSLGRPQALTLDTDKWSKTVQDLSAVFKDYPALQKSKVELFSRRTNRWLVNSEGTKIIESSPSFGITMFASAQAKDGTPMEDYDCVAARTEEAMPSFDELKSVVKALAQRVTDLQAAPKAQEYCGPVLFEGQAAAEFFSQLMVPNLGLAAEYIGEEAWRNPLRNSIGRKVLPAGITVEDDPRASEFKGTSLLGGYQFDDEGVPSSKVTLVENGVLKNFCESRLPHAKDGHSNGHALGDHGVCSVLNISSSKPSSPEEMRQRILTLAQDAGLEYVIVISRIADAYHMIEFPKRDSGSAPRSYATPSYSRQPSDPIIAYKLYLKDGHRELVRGLEFRYVSLRAFRDIQAVGDDARAYIVEAYDYVTRHLVTPSYLVGELELAPVKEQHASSPLLPSPLSLDAP